MTAHEQADLVIVGAGAAGLMAAIAAGREARRRGSPLSIVALDSARTLGAKILVAGGGRCNVTHHHVDESAYAGSTRPAVRNVLRAFTVEDTTTFFRDLGVELKREDTGKLFPVTDSARTVLNALLTAARDAGADIRTQTRVRAIQRDGDSFIIYSDDFIDQHSRTGETPASPDAFPLSPRERDGVRGDRCKAHPRDTPGSENRTIPNPVAPESRPREHGSLDPADTRTLRARRIILATGGMSLPKTGSDGFGYTLARSLGHSVTPRIFPALVPLTVPDGHFARSLAGLSTVAALEARDIRNKKIAEFTGPLLFTHFGVSGPVVLDISRYYLGARADGGATLIARWIPDLDERALDRELLSLGRRTPVRFLADRLPERLARAICEHVGVDPASPGASLRKDRRAALVAAVCRMEIPITGSKGFIAAEVTAGGVPLSEVRLDSMESRAAPGLHLVGEILDVDGRIGGFNFQWAWASGHVAGSAAARSLAAAGDAVNSPR